MKTSLFCGAVLAILGVAAAPLIGQTQAPPSFDNNYVQTSKVIGIKVKTAQGEEIGVVKDVVLERSNGCLAYTVLSTGGSGTRVTGQSKLVAVPWSVFIVAPDASYLTVSVDRDRIYNAPAFEYSRISDASYISNVYSHFAVGAGVNFSTNPTTATTGATTETQGGTSVSPTASPGASASVSPGASASPKKPSTRKSASEDSSAESENTPSGKKRSHKKGASEGTSETAPTPGGEQE